MRTREDKRPPFRRDRGPDAATPRDWSDVDWRNEEWIDDWPTVVLPSMDMETWSTMPMPAVRPRPRPRPRLKPPRLEPIEDSTLSSTARDDAAIDDMPTWVLPIVTGQMKAVAGTSSHRAVGAGAESYFTLLRNLATSSGIYALAALASPLVSLVTAPFLTHYLPQSDYGALTVLNTLVSLVAGITQLGLGSAFFRAYNYDYSSARDRRAVASSVLMIMLLVSALAAVAIVVASPAIAELLFQRRDLAREVALVGAVVFVQNLTVPGFAWLRATHKALFYSLLSIGNLVTTLAMNLVLVGVLRLGIVGSLLATGSGYTLVLLCTVPVIVAVAGIRVRFDMARGLLAFGVPMVASFTSFWILQLFDRYLLSVLGTLAQTASYGVAYSLGSVLSTVIMGPFTLAWPTAMYAIAKRKDAAVVFVLIFRWFSMAMLFAAFGLSIVSRLLLSWFFPKGYQSAALVIPVIATSLVFYGLYYLFNTGVSITRKTWYAALFTTLAAVINVALNFVLIPRFSIMGAAAATLIAYIAMALVANAVNQRLYPVPYELWRFGVALLIGTALYAATYVASEHVGGQWLWPLSFAGLVAFAACLLVVGRGFDLLALRAKLPYALRA